MIGYLDIFLRTWYGGKKNVGRIYYQSKGEKVIFAIQSEGDAITKTIASNDPRYSTLEEIFDTLLEIKGGKTKVSELESKVAALSKVFDRDVRFKEVDD